MTAPLLDRLAEAIHSWTCEHMEWGDPCRHSGPSKADYKKAAALRPLIAEVWDEGYLACSDDFEVHLNHPALECNCSVNPLAENPYRTLINARPVCHEHGGADADRLAEAVKDVCWRATQYGQTEDGDTFAYIVTKGAMHRLIAAAQSAGINAAFRTDQAELEDK